MSENPAKYESGSQQRILRALTALAGHEVDGLTVSQLATALRTSPSNALRDLANLRVSGLAEEVPGLEGRWRLGPKLIQIALAHLRHVDQAQKRLDEVQQRYSRTP